jgi:dihydroorotate dehydrogenase
MVTAMASPYSILRPVIFMVDAETAHRLAVWSLGRFARLVAETPPSTSLHVRALGLDFASPLGIGAGFDKHGEAMEGLRRLGFGFVEVGTITPKPQEGNPRPRVFRLREDHAVINRYGFNSDGHLEVRKRLQAARDKGLAVPLGVNIGANKLSDDPGGDYVQGIQRFSGLADYFVVNISSPNTPGLRSLQGRDALNRLLGRVLEARNRQERQVPVLVKIAPDLSAEARQDIAALIIAHDVEGLIVSNTTIARPDSPTSPEKAEAGGLSGAPLLDMATDLLADMYRLTHGRVLLVGAGGVSSGADAYAKIRAGATLVQLYTALVYEGPGLVKRINSELADLLKRDGFKTVADAVGAAHRG